MPRQLRHIAGTHGMRSRIDVPFSHSLSPSSACAECRTTEMWFPPRSFDDRQPALGPRQGEKDETRQKRQSLRHRLRSHQMCPFVELQGIDQAYGIPAEHSRKRPFTGKIDPVYGALPQGIERSKHGSPPIENGKVTPPV